MTSDLVSGLREPAADRTCRAIGIPLDKRAAEPLSCTDKAETSDAYIRCSAGTINQDLKRQPGMSWSRPWPARP